jgi:hypothetical protein
LLWSYSSIKTWIKSPSEKLLFFHAFFCLSPFPHFHYFHALSADPVVWENFNNLAPSHKRNYIGWISDAKREETRQRRLKEAMKLLAQNKKLGLK